MATPEQKWPRRPSVTRSPDTLSPLWPDRPIRPMPKNRLRSKLSPEQADSIIYPPHPPQTAPLFSFPYGLSDAQEGRTGSRTNGHRNTDTHCDCGGHHGDHSDEEDGGYDHPSYRWSSPGVEGTPTSNVKQVFMASRNSGKTPAAPASTTSSADGYESFENTSNKKKRKIPLSSGGGAHQSSLSADMANMGISSPPPSEGHADNGAGAQAYAQGQYAAGNAAAAGAARARMGRNGVKPERRAAGVPLTNGYASSLSAVSRGGDYRGDGTRPALTEETNIPPPDAAGQRPVTPPGGKENNLMSASGKPATPKSQFTFTCESDTSSKMVWPLQGAGSYQSPTPNKEYIPIHIREPHRRPQPHAAQPARPHQNPLSPPPLPHPPAHTNGVPPPEPKPRRRRPSKEFAFAARQRRLAQEFSNYQSKPTKDSMWICEFCEYEDIWGYPPRALIRQYEIKDRAERQRAEERRRLLEKAKMKKGKGKGKGKAKPAPAVQQDNRFDVGVEGVEEGGEYYEDEFEEGYDDYEGGYYTQQAGVPPPPPPPPVDVSVEGGPVHPGTAGVLADGPQAGGT